MRASYQVGFGDFECAGHGGDVRPAVEHPGAVLDHRQVRGRQVGQPSELHLRHAAPATENAKPCPKRGFVCGCVHALLGGSPAFHSN